MLIAAILDGGDRDPRWGETQELENAAIKYGRLLNRRARHRDEQLEAAGRADG